MQDLVCISAEATQQGQFCCSSSIDHRCSWGSLLVPQGCCLGLHPAGTRPLTGGHTLLHPPACRSAIE